jgi:hypothetical protein
MAPLHEVLPDLAERETRSVTVLKGDEYPKGHFLFVESYCNERGCDCRRVFVNVTSPDREGILATINFGWEDPEFYADWMSFPYEAQEVVELKGPSLARGLAQTELAPGLLELFRDVLATDDEYVSRLARHYVAFKRVVEREAPDGPDGRRARRNAPCPCGSGRKYKHCCGRS